MTASDAQIEIAILASIERQANRTAAALQRVVDLLGAVEEKKGLKHANIENKRRNPAHPSRHRRAGHSAQDRRCAG